jgi:hypothetical protein
MDDNSVYRRSHDGTRTWTSADGNKTVQKNPDGSILVTENGHTRKGGYLDDLWDDEHPPGM